MCNSKKGVFEDVILIHVILLLFYNPSVGKESREHVAVTKAVSISIFRKLGTQNEKAQKQQKNFLTIFLL